MHKLLDEYLCKKYPKIFADRNKPMTESCMYWGLDVGDGWFYIIDALCSNIQSWVDNPQWVEKKDLITKFKSLWNRTVWNWIVYPLVRKLPHDEYQRHSEHWQFKYDSFEPPKENPYRQVVAHQVKEKFGTLRFYYGGGGSNESERGYVRGLIQMAESISGRTCEVCGNMNKDVSSTKGWITTVCPGCVRDGRNVIPRNNADDELARIWRQVETDKKIKSIK
jgi:hypothetical protein